MTPEDRETLRRVEKNVNDIKTGLYGPPGAPEKGMIVRVDRIEQEQKTLNWVSRTLGACFLIAAARSLWNSVKGG